MRTLAKAKQGSIEKIYKSEAVPEQQDEFVHKLVYTTFNNYIDTTRKDLLIYFYADWCGYCQKFGPKFQKLAKEQSVVNTNVQFVKFNADKNDYVYEIQGFPTLVYFNHKTEMYTQFKGSLK